MRTAAAIENMVRFAFMDSITQAGVASTYGQTRMLLETELLRSALNGIGDLPPPDCRFLPASFHRQAAGHCIMDEACRRLPTNLFVS